MEQANKSVLVILLDADSAVWDVGSISFFVDDDVAVGGGSECSAVVFIAWLIWFICWLTR